jgi:hypothetical protein
MRNKFLAGFWMLVGALAALWIGIIPMGFGDALVYRFVGHNRIFQAIPEVALGLIIPAYGATWFRHLFYKGMLWGYRPDKDS